MTFYKNDCDSKQRFSIRKLNVGVCSVLLSTLFLTFNFQQVHAADNKPDANSNNPKVEITQNKQQEKPSDATSVANSAATADKSETSSAVNSTSDKTTAKSTESTALSKKTTETDNTTSIKNNSNNTSNKTNSSSTGTSNTTNKANNLSAESNKSTVLQKSATQSDLTPKNITKKANAQDDSKNNTIIVSDQKANAKASQLLNDSKIEAKKAKAEVPSQDPTPVPLHYEVGTNYIYVVVGTDIKDNPARLFKNGQELLDAGAKFSWVTAVPTITNANYNCEGGFPATIRVTYADKTYKDANVILSGEPQVTLQPKTFYYVKNVGDKVDFSQPDSNYNDYDTIIDADGVYSTSQMSYEPVGTIDTSTVGIHWAKIKVTDNSCPDGISKVVGDPYYVKIPYIVQGLKLRDDIPKDAAGNPIINAQLASQPQGTRGVPTTPVEEFAPNNGNTSLLGQYFYQDYALAYALGITTSIDGWTQPTDLINTKSNSFKLVLNYNNGSGAYKLGDSKEQKIDVHYVAAPHIDNIYFYNDGHTYFAGQTANLQTVKKIVDSGMLDKYIYVTLADGTKVYAKTITSIRQLFKGIGGAGTGVFQAGFKATFGGTNSAGQPLIFNDGDLANVDSNELVAGAGFADAVNYWYRKTNDTYDTANFGTLADSTWDRLSATAFALAPTISTNQGQGVADVTDGPVTFSDDSTGDKSLDVYIENPATAKDLNKYLNSTSAGWNWLPPATKLNPLPNNNTTWPKGTTFTWIGSDGSKALSFDKAGEIKTGNIKVTLPSGSTYTVKSITVESHANVKAKSETIDYGTILTAADLVTNKSAFPKGTTYQFANNSEPMWIRSGSYNNVQITATYKDANGKTITTDAAKCAIAINSTRSITVLEGSSVPTVDSILNFPEGWEGHTADWSTDITSNSPKDININSPKGINTNSTNDGEITVYYPSHELYQTIGVFVTVIPKETIKKDQQFFTNGNKYDGTKGSIANGANQGSILITTGDQPISYQIYQGNPGDAKSFNKVDTSYSPNFSLSGLQTNADGSLVSGVQNVTVRVPVPKGTIGTGVKVDKDGNCYYELKTNIEVAQPVTFKFVDDADNETVGKPQTQEFLKGQAKAIAPELKTPTGYKLATGQTLPTSYTLADYAKTNPVVKIHLRKDITVSFTGNDSKTYDGQPASVSAKTLSNAITSADTDTGHNLDASGLTDADFDWYQGNTKLNSVPSAVGSYTIKLNNAGLTILKNNNKNYILTLDSKKQSYTYVINAAPATVTFQGQGSKTYDGKAATLPTDVSSGSAISANLANHESLDLSGLSASDFDWYQGSTKLGSAPTAVGDYTIKLNDTGLTALKNKNKNYTLTLDPTKSYTYTIKKATASAALSGSNKMTYSGSVATTGDINAVGGNIAVTISIPNGNRTITYTLQDGDYTWNTTDGSAPSAAGSYTINLNKNNILSHLQAKIADDATWKGNVDLAETALDGSATFDIKKADANVSFQGSHTKTYDGTAVTIPTDAKTASDITATGLQGNDSLNLTDLTDADFDWYDQTGTHKLTAAPADAGNYIIKLNADGLAKLQANKNYNWGAVAGTYTYTIKKAQATATLSGGGERTYNGSAVNDNDIQKQDANNNIALKITIPGVADPQTITLTVNDFDWSQGSTKLTSVPSAAGTYNLVLSDNGKKAIAKKFSNNTNIDWTQTIASGSATYTINKATASVALVGSGERDYNGNVVSDADIQKQDANNNIALKVTIPGQTDPAIVTLKVDDFDWSQGTTKLTAVPKDAGTYILTLNAAGKQAIGNQLSSNHNIDWTHLDFTNIGSATYTINKAAVTVTMSGKQTETYDGSAKSLDLSKFKSTFASGTLTMPTIPAGTFTADDYTIKDSNGTVVSGPINAGTYKVYLNANGINKIKKLAGAGNFAWPPTAASINTYGELIIKQTEATAKLSGTNGKTYDGKAVTTTELNSNGQIIVTITVNGQTITYQLQDGDYNWENGAAPVKAGTYTINLNKDNILTHLKNKIAADSDWKGNVALTADDLGGSAIFTINKAKSTVQLTGNGNTTYNGNQVATPVAALQQNISATKPVNNEKLDVSGLSAVDFDWYDTKGNKLTKAPTNAGTYTISLNGTGLAVLNNKNGNYALTLDKKTNSYTYKINPLVGSVVFNGSHTETYTGKANTNPTADFSLALNADNKNGYSYHDNYSLKDGDIEYQVNGHWTTSVPIKVGKYRVQLTNQGWRDVKKFNGNNISWAATSVKYAKDAGYYIITTASASAKLSGSNQRDYNGSTVTTADINANGSSIQVTLTFPDAATGNNTFTLSDSQYTWQTTGNVAPKDAGTYTLVLNNTGLTALQNYIDSVAGKGNVKLDANNMTGSATFTINKVAITITQGGSDSKTYNGHPVTTPTTALTNNISNDGGMISGETLNIPSLIASDFDWYDANGNRLDNAPTDAGNYTIKLNSNGLKKLQDSNKNYSLNPAITGDFAYTINRANATIKLDPSTNKQTAVWDGNTIALDPVNFKPVIATDNSNQPTISLPSDFHLTASDYVITQKGATVTAKEPGQYTVTLTEAGWQKVRGAISGNKNYNWTPTGHGTLIINKASSTVKLSGSGSVDYTGSVAQIPYNNGIYKVDLSNGKTYTLQAGDLEFVKSTGNTNVGTYEIKLSSAAITHINELTSDDSAHYNYTYDNSTATLDVKAATATATLSGHNSRSYNGQAVTTDDINANGGTIQISLTFPGVTNKIFTLKDGQYTWRTTDNAAPINADSYTLKLNKAGLTALQNYIDSIAGTGNVILSTTDTGSATFDITAQNIGVVINGKAYKTYDGENAVITQQDLDSGKVSIKWGTNSDKPTDISFNLDPNDFEVVDSLTGTGNPVSAVNVINATTDETNKTYYIRLTSAAFNRLKNQNKNYKFTLDQENSHAVFLIYARKAALTLSGTQTVNYGTDPGQLDLKKFNVDFSNWATASGPKPVITLENGDLQVIADSGNQYSPDKLPINAGQYQVVMTTQLINRLKNSYKNYDFDNIPDVKDAFGHVTKPGQDDKHQPASYIVQPLQINATITGKQSVEYDPSGYTIDPNKYGLKFNTIASRDEAVFKGFKLTTGDLEFITTPSDVGTYQVRLTKDAIKRMKEISGINPANYDWTVLASDLPTANFEVTQKPVTIVTGDKDSSQPQTSVYGKPVVIDPNDYSVTVQDENGQAIILNNISFTADDFEFQGGTPSDVGNYTVVLSENGINKVENKLGTKNYSFSNKGTGNYKITAAQATVSLTGGQSSTYDAHATQLTNTDGYTLTINTDNGPLDFTFNSSDLQFVDKDGNRINNPTVAGTYNIALTTNAQNAIKKLGGNDGKNYGFTFNKSIATYIINKSNAKAVFGGNGSKNYDGSAIDNYTTPIGITITAPGTVTTIGLTAGTDYVWTKDGHTYKTAPVDAGTYSIELTDAGKTKIKNVNATNLDWKDTDITGTGTYTIHQVAATVTMDGSQTETYNGNAKPLNLSDFVPAIKSGNLKMPTIPAGTFARGDYDVVDSKGNKLSDNQLINAGTYRVELNANGLSKLEALTGASNFTWPATVDTIGTLTIKQASTIAKLNGNNSKVYDGQGATTADLNKGGLIAVTITVNGQTITYKLKNGDYSWNIPDGSVPVNVGNNYSISLNKDAILAHLKDEIDKDKPELKGNYQLTANDLSGTATFTITQKDLTITQKGSDSKTYDSKAGSVTLKELTDGLSTKGLANGEALNTDGLTLSDFDWSDANHINAGPYTITLNAAGLAKLKSDNSNYSFDNVGGSFTYTINKAAATATLSGFGERTYNGSAVNDNDIQKQDANNNIALKITIPGVANSQTITLTVDDFDWSQGSTKLASAPTAAGTYKLVLNDNGKEAIAKKFSSNTNIDWKKTIANGSATYTINKLASDAVMANAQTGNYKMTYNGAAPSSIDSSKFIFTTTVNGQIVTLDATGLNSSDFTWADGSAPVNVGTYKVVLTDSGLAKLNAKNTNFILSKAGNGTFTINQANASATLSGSASRKYNGQAVTVDEVNNDGIITLTLHYPKDGNADYSKTVKLSSGDFRWNTSNGQAPVDANAQPYSITLNQDALEKIIKQAVGTGQNGVSNVKFADNAITGTANFTITPLNTDAILANVTEGNYSKVYDAKVTNQIDPTKFQITVTVAGKKVTLNTQSFTGNSYEWVDASGNVLTENPKNVGTYYVKLSDAAFNSLQAENPNFTLTNTGLGIYTIKPAQATAALRGSNSKVYDRAAISLDQLNSNGDIKIELNFPGVNGQTYILKQGDYTINGNATDAGKYTISLTDIGIANVKNYIESLAGNGQNNQSNVIFTTNAISGTADFEIIPSVNVISVSGTQTETYNGSTINVVYNADGTNSVVVSIAKADNTTGALASLTKVTLNSGDFTVVNGPAVDANTYQVQLTPDGLTKIQKALGKNYSISLDTTATGKLVVKKATASAKFSGQPSFDYTGTSVSPDEYLSKYSIDLNEPNNPTYKLVAGDIEFNVNGTWTMQAPVNVGTYDVRLSQQGWNHIKAINSDNVEWPGDASAGEGTYTINQAKVTAELSGKNSRVYNGSAVSTADLYTNGSTIKVVINGTGINDLPTTFTLSDGDYTWTTSDGQAPVDVGNYTIKLTPAGINKIQSIIDKAVGAGNVDLTTTVDNAGAASFEIEQEVASNVQLYGNEQSIYNGHAVNFDPANSQVAKNFGFNNVENLTVPAFNAGDFSWYDEHGKEISAPINAGTYYLRLNSRGEQAFANANKNYTFVDPKGNSTISGQITYVVTPAELTVKVTGNASKVYDGKNAEVTQDQIDNGDIKLVWGDSTSEPVDLGKFTLTPADFKVVDAGGQPVFHANFDNDVQIQKRGTYYVQLTDDAIAKIKQLNGASNYNISQITDSATYMIYTHKAELTIKGNQTTSYGTELPFDESKYNVDFSNWVNINVSKPLLTWQNGELFINGQRAKDNYTYHTGDLYVEGYPNGGVPTEVGSYKVKISAHLTEELHKLFPDYDFSGNVASGSSDKTVDNDPVDASHEPATYVITPAQTTIKINGAQHVKYGESTAITDDQYTASVTAPVDGKDTTVVTNVALTSADLTTVPSDSKVGSYTLKLTDAGLAKIQTAITGHGDVTKNYSWKQAKNVNANFFVDQMPVAIVVSGQSSVNYGSQDWLKAIKSKPTGYILTITTENGTKLNYTAADSDLVFAQTPGNVGTYQVELSGQGLTNIEKALGTNYAYPQVATDVTAKGTFTVNQGEVTVTLSGNKDGKTYDASQTLPSGLDLSKYSLTSSVTVYLADGTAQTLNLTAADLQIVGNATNVGTYQVELSPAGQERLEQLTGNNGANYKWTFVNKADYKITTATAKANLNGFNQKQFDGSAVTTAEVNSNGQILVHFTFPGSTTQSTYALQDGDYTWDTKDGKAPTNVGTYTITLNKSAVLAHLQAALNTQAGDGNVTISKDNLTGYAKFKITPKTITNVTVSGDEQSKTYDGHLVNLDVSGLRITADGTLADTSLVNPGIKVSDFSWYDANGNQLDGAPTNVGNYQARLKASTLAELQEVNPNYQFSSVDGVINYEIKPASAIATISGSSERDYNAQTTSIQDVMDNIKWTSTGLVTGQSLNHAGLTADSYAWYTKNSEGNYVAMTGNPVNAGTYYLRLTDAAIAQIKADNPNYNFTSVNGEYIYTINAIAGTATLNGSASKTYDDQTVTTAEVDSTNGDIVVHFTFPGSTAQSTYTLQDGDYTWDTEDGNAPINAGTYTIKLNEAGLAHFQSKVNQYIGQGNVTLDAQKLLGSATYTIKRKKLDVTVDNQTGAVPGKTYDGAAATINPADANLTAQGLIAGQTLNTSGLTDGDFEWVDANGKHISVPINAGTYYIVLTTDGLQRLQADNPNYAVSESGGFKYVISPLEAKVTIKGRQESASTTIDGKHFEINVPTGVKVPTGMTYEFASGTVPTQSGVYLVSLTPESLSKLQKANSNYKLRISSTAEFTLDATLTIIFQDTDENNKQVGDAITKTGVAESSIAVLGLTVPDGYVLAPNQSLPTNYTFGENLQQNLYIKLVHQTKNVDPLDPSTNPDPKNQNWFKENGLVKDVTRTINYQGLTDEQLSEIPDSEKKQIVQFTRAAKYDVITGKLVNGSEGDWRVGTLTEFTGFTPHTFAGYTADKVVPNVTVNSDSQNVTVVVTYTADNHDSTITYVDKNGKTVKVDQISGKTGETIKINPDVPAGWQIVPGQDIPEKVKVTPDGMKPITINIEHKTTTVTPDTPHNDIPTGQVPGDPSKNYDPLKALIKTPTRIITVITPSGSKLLIKQTVTFTRTATFDQVTGKATYSDWKLSGSDQWDAYSAPSFAGYTASQSEVATERVSIDTPDSNIEITYKQDDVPTPQPPTPEPGPQPDTPNKPTKPDSEPDKPTQPDKPTKPAKPNKPVKPNKPNKPGHKPGKPNHKPIKPNKPNKPRHKPGKPSHESVKPNKNNRTHSKSNKKGYSFNNRPKNEKLTGNYGSKLAGQNKNANAGQNENVNGPIKAADAELGEKTMSKAEPEHLAETKHLAGKLNVKSKSAEDLLPQTGNEHNHILGVIGALLAGLGWISLLGIEKRKKKDE